MDVPEEQQIVENKTDVFTSFHSLFIESVQQKASQTKVEEQEAKKELEISPNFNKKSDMSESYQKQVQYKKSNVPQGSIKTENDHKSEDIKDVKHDTDDETNLETFDMDTIDIDTSIFKTEIIKAGHQNENNVDEYNENENKE